MEEQIEESGLTFGVNMPDSPVYIMSDGKRLYRVFQNLHYQRAEILHGVVQVYVNLIPEKG